MVALGPGLVYAQSGTVAPSAVLNTNGPALTFTPPAGYNYVAVLHIGLSNAGVGAETITMQCTGTMDDGSQVSNTNTYATNTGDMDNQHYLEPANGITAASGQLNTKRTASVSFVAQSTINNSGASATVRFWAIAYN